ncbi:cysteine protease ATG4C-like [Halichondria panicea]|uniref:cysteine protease ATG4C-like n=1 Tax=Halichondria panicea TaxID=6063 RepID=UPI00312B45DB
MAKQRSAEAPPFRERVYTTLYRLRYGWQFRSSVEISKEEPIWVLGTNYYDDPESGDKHRDVEGAPPHVMAFMEHFYSVPWMTYRSNFPPISNTALTTVCGWGCMLRSGQMVLATALNRHMLGRDWRLPTSSDKDKDIHAKVMSWFADCPSPQAQFFMHALMDQAVRHDNHPGDWFGPSQVSVLMRECMKVAKTAIPDLKNVQVYVTYDCTVYVKDVLQLFHEQCDEALATVQCVKTHPSVAGPSTTGQ